MIVKKVPTQPKSKSTSLASQRLTFDVLGFELRIEDKCTEICRCIRDMGYCIAFSDWMFVGLRWTNMSVRVQVPSLVIMYCSKQSPEYGSFRK